MTAVTRVALMPVRVPCAVLGECGADPRVAEGQLLPWAGHGLCPPGPGPAPVRGIEWDSLHGFY